MFDAEGMRGLVAEVESRIAELRAQIGQPAARWAPGS
jgi:hypothetical protein